MDKKVWPRSVVGPIILVALGLAFLLSNLGVLNWNVWQMLWRLWPVWLIAVGLDLLIGRRSQWSGLVVAAMVLAILAGGVWFYASEIAPHGQEVTSQSIHQPLGGAARAEVEIKSSVGELRLGSTEDRSVLVTGNINRLTGERFYHDYAQDGDTARFALRSDLIGVMPNQRPRQGVWELDLNRSVSMSLKVHTGVGESTLDLSRLNLTDLDLSIGVGRVDLTLPEQGKVRAAVHAGVGETTVSIPSSMAARIRVRQGLGAIEVNGNFLRDGDTYVSPGFGTAQNQLDLDLSGGIGHVVIDQIER